LLEDSKTPCKKNKGVTSLWLLSEKSMAITMAAVQQGFLNVLQKNVVTKLASNFFKQQQSKYFK
jgi:hypothetical protein